MQSRARPALRTASLLALAASFAAPSEAPAQILAELPDSGFLRGAPPVPRSDLAARCVVPVGITPETEPTGACEVRQILDLGPGWTAAWYRRPTAWSGPPAFDSWVDQVVLFSTEGPDRAVPRWRYEVEGVYLFVAGLRTAARREGTLFELLLCLNGTGGCAREYVLLGDGGELGVVALPFVAALQATLPAGLRLHKGMTLDLETLSGVWPVAAQEDPNCCPSRALSYEVRLVDASLELVRSTLSPP